MARRSGRSRRKSSSTVRTASNKSASNQANKASSPKFKGIGAGAAGGKMPKTMAFSGWFKVGLLIPEVWISIIVGFISGATSGIVGMMFWIRQKEKKLES